MANDKPIRDDDAQPGSDKPRRAPRLFRIFAWVAGSLVIVAAVAVAGLIALVNTDGVHRYLIGLAQREAGSRLGVRVQLENFTLHPAALSVDVYGITVDGASPYEQPPLLRVDHVQVGVRIVSIFGRKWHLSNLRIDHPVAWIVIRKDGTSNLPRFKSSSPGSTTSIFDLGIRRVLLNRGEVYFNSRPQALSADVRDLNFHSSFNRLRTMYSGQLAYTDARFQYGAFRPLAHDLDLRFDATPSAFHVQQAKLTSGPSQIILSGTLDHYENPTVHARYDAAVDGEQLGRLLHSASIPAGLLHAAGSLEYEQAAGRSWLRSLALDGDLTSRAMQVKTADFHAQVANFAAHYSLADGDARVNNLRAKLLGGALTAQATMKNLDGEARSNATASLQGASLAQLRSALVHSNGLPGVALTGTLNATAAATWGKMLSSLAAHANANLKGQVARRTVAPAAGANEASASASTRVIPVESLVRASYTGSSRQFALDHSYLHTPQTDLTMNGIVGRHSSLAVHLEANDLEEVAAIADLFRAPAADVSPHPLDLEGKANFEGTIQGTIDAPHIQGELMAQNLRFNGTEWKALRAGVAASPDQLRVQHADLESASGGRVTLDASAGLEKWSLTKTSPIQAQGDVSQLEMTSLTKLIGRQVPVTGKLNARLAVHGTTLNPEGQGKITLTGVSVYGQPIQSIAVNLSGSGEQARAELAIESPVGNVHGSVTVEPRQKTYTAQLASSALHVGELEVLKARNIDAAGTLAFDAKGQGSFDDPQLEANLQIPDLVVAGKPISDVKLNVNLAHHVANAALAASAAGAPIQAKARVGLSGDYPTDATLDTQAFPLEPVLAAYVPGEISQVSGESEVHATLHGPLRDRSQLEAHVSIPMLKVGYSNTVQLAAASPIQMDYKNGVLFVQPASIRGTDADLQLQAAVPIDGNGPASLQLHGSVNLQLVQLFNPDLRSSGQLKLNIDSHGPISDGKLGGKLGGEIDIVDASLSSADMPVGLQHGNGVLTLTTDRVNIDKFQGSVGGGTITAQGGIAYRPRLQFNLGVAAKDVRVLYPRGLRENVDAKLTLAGTYERAFLGGSVDLTDLSLTPGFDLAAFTSQFSGNVAAPVSQGFAQNVALNVAVRSTNNVNLVSRTLTVNGSANLQVRGTAADPVILGRVNLTGGDIFLNGDRYVLTGGTVQFVNPSQTEPVLNVSLNTTIQEYKIDLRFNGPADQMRTEYTSDPALPQADIIHLLAFGQTTEASAQNPVTANQAAESLVASQVSSQITSRISKVAGISQLSISPVLAQSSQSGPAGANITIRQRVTSNLFVTFSTNVSTTQDQTIQGQYQISRRMALSATRDPNGGFAVDALIKNSW